MNLRVIKANMTELDLNGVTILFSYNTPVAYKEVFYITLVDISTNGLTVKYGKRHRIR